jgi:hypothetical protein
MPDDVAAVAARHALEQRVAGFTAEERREAARQEAARVEAERREAARLEQERHDADAHALVVAGEVAAATAALHAQVATILNIKSLVPIVLDFASPHYNRWNASSSTLSSAMRSLIMCFPTTIAPTTPCGSAWTAPSYPGSTVRLIPSFSRLS